MRREHWVFGAAAWLVAFCSMAYELTLAQCISVLYGDTITNYSLVIGVFVLSLGLGSAYWAKALRPPTLAVFWTIEIALAVVGAVAPAAIFRVEFGGDAAAGFPQGTLIALGFAFAVGFLSGMEIPVLIALAGRRKTAGARGNPAALIVGMDFMGTFAASVIVPLVLFYKIGLIGVPLLGSLLNLGLGLVALTPAATTGRGFRVIATVLVGILVAGALSQVASIEAYLSKGVF